MKKNAPKIPKADEIVHAIEPSKAAKIIQKPIPLDEPEYANKLRNQRTAFEVFFWDQLLRAQEHYTEKLNKLKGENEEKILRAKKRFIKKVKSSLGDNELADQLIIDQIEYDHIRKVFTTKAPHGTIPPPIDKPYFGIAVLRNDALSKIKEDFTVDDELFFAELASGEKLPSEEQHEIDEVEKELRSISMLIKEVQKMKGLKRKARKQVKALSAEEMAQHIQNNYGKTKVAKKRVIPLDKAKHAAHLNTDEMGEHIQRQYGLPSDVEHVAHFGPENPE